MSLRSKPLAWLSLVAVGATGSLMACTGSTLRQFPDRLPVWRDDDMRLSTRVPETYETTPIWDGADNTVFLPLSRAFAVPPTREAENVNSLDEVPDSSWFTNRLGQRQLTVEEVRRGPCDSTDPPPGPWTIVSGKTDGVNPGFVVKDGKGRKHLFKVDGDLQPERGTGSDAVGSRIMHAAGFYAPCNRVIPFTKDSFVIPPKTYVKLQSGEKQLLTSENVEKMIKLAVPLGGGVFRGSFSEFIAGKLIGPWKYEGVKKDDPNDVIDHERRRELRGLFLLNAWIDHIDCREENTMASWMAEKDGGPGYVRHYMIDFSDTLGSIWVVDAMSRRIGYSNYIDLGQIGGDFLTLGFPQRPWDKAVRPPTWPVFGYYDVERFVPESWHPGYPNPASTERTERDLAWMARIIANFDDERVVAVASAGEFTKPLYRDEILRILRGRRIKILERFLTKLSPLDLPRVEGPNVCVRDLAVSSGLRPSATRLYSAKVQALDGGKKRALAANPRGSDVCVTLGSGVFESAGYVIVDVVSQTPGVDEPGPLQVHLRNRGDGQWFVVGMDWPEHG